MIADVIGDSPERVRSVRLGTSPRAVVAAGRRDGRRQRNDGEIARQPFAGHERLLAVRAEADRLALRRLGQRHADRGRREGTGDVGPGERPHVGVGVGPQRQARPVGRHRSAGDQQLTGPTHRTAGGPGQRDVHRGHLGQRHRSAVDQRRRRAVHLARPQHLLRHEIRRAVRCEEQRLGVVRTVGVGQPVHAGGAVRPQRDQRHRRPDRRCCRPCRRARRCRRRRAPCPPGRRGRPRRCARRRPGRRRRAGGRPPGPRRR